MGKSNDTNKVKYGLRNVHLFEITDSGTKLTYGTPVPWRGATELTLDPNGDALEVYADDILYDKEENNQGYTGKLTMLYLQPEIEALLFGNVENADGVVVENADNHGSKVAMAFEFSGDNKHVRHVLYNVSFSRAGDGSATKSDKIDAQTAEFEFSAMPDPYDYKIKGKAAQGSAKYDKWFTAVYVPGASTPMV